MTNFGTRTERGWRGLSGLFDSLPTSDAPRRVSAICRPEALDGAGWLLGTGGASLTRGALPQPCLCDQVSSSHRRCYNQRRALAEGRCCLLLDGLLGVLKSTLPPCCPNTLLHAGKRVGDCLLISWAAVKGRVSLVHKYTCPVFILAHSSGQILA